MSWKTKLMTLTECRKTHSMQTADKSFESYAKFKFVNYINESALHAWRNEEETELSLF
jgi:hypothetical protein